MSQFSNKAYNLEERTALFAEKIIDLCKSTPKNTVTTPIVDQLIRASSSVGANYREANGASSKKDFKNKIFTCKKEAKETEYWLRLLARADNRTLEEGRILWKEAHELTLIFSKIASSTKLKIE